MNRKFVVASWIALIGFAAGISVFSWTIYSTAKTNRCVVCKRHVHAETRTVAEVGGRRTILCCPTCVRVLRDRRGGDVTVLELTDHETGESLDPGKAYLVVGTDVNCCVDNAAHLDEHKDVAPVIYDRCSPSMIAFRRLEAAEAFQAAHGGELTPAVTALGFAPAKQ